MATKEEEDIKHNIAERILALQLDKKQSVRAILNAVKHMKEEEGKTETDIGIIAKVAELEQVLGGLKRT